MASVRQSAEEIEPQQPASFWLEYHPYQHNIAAVNITVSGMSVEALRPKPMMMRRGRGDQRSVQLHAAAEAARPDVDEEDQQRRKNRRRQARRRIAYAAGRLVCQHRAPVIERRLLQPGMAVENRSDPVVARQHFARDLRVAGLVGADQADNLQAEQKEESAEGDERESVGERRVRRQAGRSWSSISVQSVAPIAKEWHPGLQRRMRDVKAHCYRTCAW